MESTYKEKVFYEAMWFSDTGSSDPIVRGYHIDDIIRKLLTITRNDHGTIEVYKITHDKMGHDIELVKKFLVINELELLS